MTNKIDCHPTRYGPMQIIANDQIICASIRTYGEWAQEELDMLGKILRLGDYVLDVGAFIGTHSLAFAHFVGKEGRVDSFEPRPELFAVLEANLKIHNSCQNVVLHQSAVGAERGLLIVPSLDLTKPLNFGAEILTAPVKSPQSVVEVDVIRIDDLPIVRLDFLKIDVEGAEAQVLIGAAGTIERFQPFIFAECNSIAASLPVFNQARQNGFKVWGWISDAFNPNNFLGVAENIFGSAAECGLLLVPEQRKEHFDKEVRHMMSGEITDADGLALLLLHKPQYSGEILAATPVAQRLGLGYPSSQTRLLAEKKQISTLEMTRLQALDNLLNLQSEHSKQLTTEIVRLQAQSGFLHQRNAELQRLRTTIHHLKTNVRLEKSASAHLQVKFDSSEKKRLTLEKVVASAKNWQMRSWFKRAFHRWRIPGTEKNQVGFFRKLERSLRRRRKYFHKPTLETPPVPNKKVQKPQVISQKKLIETKVVEVASNYKKIFEILDVTTSKVNKPESDLPRLPSINETDILQALGKLSFKNLVVSVSHDDYFINCGGIQARISDEEKHFLKEGWAYFHLSPSSHSRFLVKDSAYFTYSLRLNGTALGTVLADDVEKALLTVKAGQINLHCVLHHLMGHNPARILALANLCDSSQSIVWIHDFFTLCPSYTLLRNGLFFCNAPSPKSAGCSVCCYGNTRVSHLTDLGYLFEQIKPRVMAPSKVTLDLWLEKSELPHTSAGVLSYGEIHWQEINAKTYSEPLRIAFVGLPRHHKGWEVFLELAKRAASDARYQFYQLGSLPQRDSSTIQHIRVKVGPEDRNAMSETIRREKIDVVVSWSLWPETFCLAAHEALAGGAYVIARREAGNVWPGILASNDRQGCVLDEENQLFDLFEGDGVFQCLETADRKYGEIMLNGGTAVLLLKGTAIPN